MEDMFGNWKAENYIAAAGVAVGAAGLAAGQRPPGQPQAPVKPVPFKRSKYDITMPIFRAEAQRRKILRMKDECKSNWLGNGFNSIVYDLLFFELEELKIVNDTGNLLNGDYLFVVNKNLVNATVIHKLNTSGFKNELQCYHLNEKELYNFLAHYKNKAVVNQNLKNKTNKAVVNQNLKSKTKKAVVNQNLKNKTNKAVVNQNLKSKTNVKVKSKTNVNVKIKTNNIKVTKKSRVK
jgi:nucleoside diphosphate kinase